MRKLFPLVEAALTPKLKETAYALMDGLSGPEIALRIGCAERTVKNRMAKLFKAFGIKRDRAKLGYILLAKTLHRYSSEI